MELLRGWKGTAFGEYRSFFIVERQLAWRLAERVSTRGPQVLKIGFSSMVGVNCAWLMFRLERARDKSGPMERRTLGLPRLRSEFEDLAPKRVVTWLGTRARVLGRTRRN